MAVLLWIGLQALSLLLQLIGAVILAGPCYLRSWHPAPSTENRIPQTINVWDSAFLNRIYGNDEDGVTGKPGYNTEPPSRLKAYVWSAWRNPVDNLKYWPIARRPGGPLLYRRFGAFYVEAGWNASGLIVASAGRA
jgi:hypothetical protein